MTKSWNATLEEIHAHYDEKVRNCMESNISDFEKEVKLRKINKSRIDFIAYSFGSGSEVILPQDFMGREIK